MAYRTKQKDAVLRCIMGSEGRHVTAEGIIAQLSAQGTPVGKATVYRYLAALAQEGIVRKFVLEEGAPACYQYSCQHEGCRRYHLKCSACGGLTHAELPGMLGLETLLRQEYGFVADVSKTVIYGKCRACAKERV